MGWPSQSRPLKGSPRDLRGSGSSLFASGAEVNDAVAPLGLDAATQRAVLDRSARLAERWTKLASLELRERVRSLVQQIQIGEAQILVWLNRAAIVSSVMPDAPPKPTDSVEPFVLSIAASLRRAGRGVRLVIGNGAAKAIDDGLASLIARAIATRNMFLAGRDDSIDAMASRLGVRRDYVAVLVRLSYLSPEIVRAILVGQQPVEPTPTRLVMLSRNLPHDWQEQRRLTSDLRLPDAAPIQHNARHVTGRKRALETSRAFARLRPRICVSGSGPL
jgi:hypothetical protein